MQTTDGISTMDGVQAQGASAGTPRLAPELPSRSGLGARLFALTALSGTVLGLGWLLVSIGQVFTDSWIAPISLTPDSDAVLQLDLELTRQRAEMGRVEAELARIDAEIVAIDQGLAQLSSLRDRSRALYEYGAEQHGAAASTLAQQTARLREERAILDRLHERQEAEVERMRANLAAGLVERRELEREEQSLDSLALQRVENARALEQAEAQRRVASSSAGEFRAELDGGAAAARMPEIVQREEAQARLEVEVVRLQAERRGLVALREVGASSLAELREVMRGIEARPLFRATQEAMDVAFVPYEQLDGVQAGDRLLQCELGIFACGEVGTVREVLPGEVVTQDPWGELARGRYAVLALSDRSAVQERILRVR